MIPYERREIILSMLKDSEMITLEELASALDSISESTLRRDLRVLAEEGDVDLIRGGRVRLRGGSQDTSFDTRNLSYTKQKEMIAKKAGSLVKDGEVVYIDSGSTSLKVVKYIKRKDITIITTNARIFSELDDARCKCIIVGGDLINSTASLVGPQTEEVLSTMFFDKAFIGVSGISTTAGATTPDVREAYKKKLIVAHSKKAFVLADSSKAGVTTMCRAIDLEDVTIICDTIPPEFSGNENFISAE